MGEFFDLPMSGKVFSWYGPENKRSRIDQFLVSCGWINNFRDLCQRGLSKSVSDHIPIFVTLKLTDWGPRPFKFYDCWLLKKGGLEEMKNEWKSYKMVGRAGFCFKSKLVCLKRFLKK